MMRVERVRFSGLRTLAMSGAVLLSVVIPPLYAARPNIVHLMAGKSLPENAAMNGQPYACKNIG